MSQSDVNGRDRSPSGLEVGTPGGDGSPSRPSNGGFGTIALPEQKAFFKIPARFGHVPVAEEPLGYDHERRFEQHYPRIELPFQLVDTVETGIKKRHEWRAQSLPGKSPSPAGYRMISAAKA